MDARARARRAREAAYREVVFEAAESCFAAKGIEDTKVEEIAAEAGISLATLYAVFRGGKQEIAETVHAARLDEISRFGVEAESSGRDPEAAIRVAFQQAIEFLVLHRSYLRIHLNEGHAWGLPDAIAARSQADARGFREGVGGLERVIARGMNEGVFRVGSARRAARTLVMMQQIHFVDWIEAGEHASADEIFEDFWRDASAFLGPGSRTGFDQGGSGG